MTLPTPLRTARAIALLQGWAAGLGVVVMLAVAVIAAGGLRNGAFVALALLFLAGDVLALSVAVVIAARRLAEGAAWARLLLDVFEGVTIAVGLLAVLMGTWMLGFLIVAIGATVLLCLHAPSSTPVFAGQSLLPWDRAPRAPEAPAFPVPTLPRRPRSGMARPPVTASRPASPAAPRRPPTPGTSQPPATEPGRRYSWQGSSTPVLPPERVPRPADLPSGSERRIPTIEPLPPPVPTAAEDPVPLITPPVVSPPEEPPGRPFVVPPLEKLTEVPRHPVPPPPDPEEAPVVRPFVVPSSAAPPAAAASEEVGTPEETPAAAPTTADTEEDRDHPAAPPAAAAATAPPTTPGVELAGTPAAKEPAAAAPTPPSPAATEPAPPPPPDSTGEPAAAVLASSALPPPPRWAGASTTRPSLRSGVITVFERSRRAAVRPSRPAPTGMPPAPSWAWRKIVIAASLLGAVAGGTLSAIGLIAGGGVHLPATGEVPGQHPPRTGSVPGGTAPAPPIPRSEPAAAGGVAGVTVTPGAGCVAGSACTVTVRVDLKPHGDELVAWTLIVADRCTSQHDEIAVTGIPAPGSYRFVLSTNQVTVPAWRSPQILAVTTSPARASSTPIVLGGASGC